MFISKASEASITGAVEKVQLQAKRVFGTNRTNHTQVNEGDAEKVDVVIHAIEVVPARKRRRSPYSSRE